MDMFTGINGEIVMDYKDYIREKCGSEILDHIEFYIRFYESVLTSYESFNEKYDEECFDNLIEDIEDSKIPDKERNIITSLNNFAWDIICEL